MSAPEGSVSTAVLEGTGTADMSEPGSDSDGVKAIIEDENYSARLEMVADILGIELKVVDGKDRTVVMSANEKGKNGRYILPPSSKFEMLMQNFLEEVSAGPGSKRAKPLEVGKLPTRMKPKVEEYYNLNAWSVKSQKPQDEVLNDVLSYNNKHVKEFTVKADIISSWEAAARENLNILSYLDFIPQQVRPCLWSFIS